MLLKGFKSVTALLLCALIAVCGAGLALADVSEMPSGGEEAVQTETESPSASDEDEGESESPTHQGQSNPATESGSEPEPQSAEEPPEAADDPQQPDQEEEPAVQLPDEQDYVIAWSSRAFAAQTINHQDELVLGLGATCRVDPAEDIEVITDGAKGISRPGDMQISFTSSNTKYLTVSKKGRIKALRCGSAQLYVTAQFSDGSQKQLRKTVKIVEAPRIRFAPASAVLENGASLDLSQYCSTPLLMASPNVNADVRYTIAALNPPGDSSVRLDSASGKLSVSYETPGDSYLITATTYSGQEATFTLHLGLTTQFIEIQAPSLDAETGAPTALRPGQTVALRAAVYNSAGGLSETQQVAWVVIGGGQFASVNADGLLTIADDAHAGSSVAVAAMACDGSGVTAQIVLEISK